MGLVLKPPTESWQGALSGCLWASITTFSFFHVKQEEERKKTITYTPFACAQSSCRIRTDLILLKMKPTYSPWKIRISLVAVFASSVISFGDRFYLLSPPSDEVENFPIRVARCTVMFPVLFVRKWLILHLKAVEISQVLHQSAV